MVVVGRIQGPYGVRGWLHVTAFTEVKENLLAYRPWYRAAPGVPGAEQIPPEDWRLLEVEEIRPHRQGFVARFASIRDRNQAEALKGQLIGVPATELPEPETDEYYWHDLIGARVFRTDGTELGTVRELLETGANDVLVVQSSQGAPADELLIPFHRRYVLSVAVDASRLEVDWPEEEPE